MNSIDWDRNALARAAMLASEVKLAVGVDVIDCPASVEGTATGGGVIRYPFQSRSANASLTTRAHWR